MGTHKARIDREIKDKVSLCLEINETLLIIPLTDDKPNEVKQVFNKLLKELKNGLFNFELEQDDKQDLYYHTCVEYISQLNTELNSVYSELVDYDLITES
ncbi:MAG: hypothetical protein JW783_07785 [Bacteroidales bacterium]|nr:hypothetical protein [Bacteroidales bacterium]